MLNLMLKECTYGTGSMAACYNKFLVGQFSVMKHAVDSVKLAKEV